MSDLANTIHALPWSGLIPVALLVIVGLLLWMAGRRVLRAGFIIIGLGFGGLIGWVLGDSIKMGVQPWIAMCIGAAALATVTALTYRFTVVAALALVCGFMAPLAVLTLAQSQTASADPKPSHSASSGLMSGLKEILAEHKGNQGDTPEAVQYWRTTLKEHDRLSENADRHLEQARTVAQQAAQVSREAWNRTPQNLRPTLIASAIIGTIAGVLLGIVAPMLGAAAVTSLGGSLLWLGGGRVLAVGIGAPDGWWPSSGSGWFTLWLITASIGVVIQWALRSRLADKTA